MCPSPHFEKRTTTDANSLRVTARMDGMILLELRRDTRISIEELDKCTDELARQTAARAAAPEGVPRLD